jgi:hypothetical protein
MTILPVPYLASLARGDRLLEDFAAPRDEVLLTEPNEHPRQGMRAAMKRNALDFTSGQFFALRRGASLATATCAIGVKASKWPLTGGRHSKQTD